MKIDEHLECERECADDQSLAGEIAIQPVSLIKLDGPIERPLRSGDCHCAGKKQHEAKGTVIAERIQILVVRPLWLIAELRWPVRLEPDAITPGAATHDGMSAKDLPRRRPENRTAQLSGVAREMVETFTCARCSLIKDGPNARHDGQY